MLGGGQSCYVELLRDCHLLVKARKPYTEVIKQIPTSNYKLSSRTINKIVLHEFLQIM